MQNEYYAFILAAYGISLVALLGLGLWVFFDARSQKLALKALEDRGVRRRSQRQGSVDDDALTGTAR